MSEKLLEERLLIDRIMELPKLSHDKRYSICLEAIGDLAEDAKDEKISYDELEQEITAFVRYHPPKGMHGSRPSADVNRILKTDIPFFGFTLDMYRNSMLTEWAAETIAEYRGLVENPKPVEKAPEKKTMFERLKTAEKRLAPLPAYLGMVAMATAFLYFLLSDPNTPNQHSNQHTVQQATITDIREEAVEPEGECSIFALYDDNGEYRVNIDLATYSCDSVKARMREGMNIFTTAPRESGSARLLLKYTEGELSSGDLRL